MQTVDHMFRSGISEHMTRCSLISRYCSIKKCCNDKISTIIYGYFRRKYLPHRVIYSSSNLRNNRSSSPALDLADDVCNLTVGNDVASSSMSSFAILGIGASWILAMMVGSSVGVVFISTCVGLR